MTNLNLASNGRRALALAALAAGLAMAALGAQHGTQSQVHNLGLAGKGQVSPASASWNATPASASWNATPASASWNATPASASWNATPASASWN